MADRKMARDIMRPVPRTLSQRVEAMEGWRQDHDIEHARSSAVWNAALRAVLILTPVVMGGATIAVNLLK